MCIVTKKRKPKNELMRFVRVDGKVIVDPKGKARGRGANITMNLDLFDEASKKHLIEKALNLDKKLTPEEISILRKDFQAAIEEKKFRKGSKPVVVRVGKNGKAELIDKK